MRGHIRKRGRSWSYVVDVGESASGRRRQQWRSGFATKREAEGALAEVVQRINAGSFVEPSKQTVAQFLEEWLASIASSVRPSTYATYAMLCRKHLSPRLGAIPLQRVSVAQLNDLYAMLLEDGRRDGKGGLSPRTVRYIHGTIRKALAEAVRWGRLPRNVADLASPPRARTTSQPVTWAAQELRAFLEHVRGDRLYPLYHLAATTGLRRGEVLGARWRDLDLENGRLAVSQTVISVDYHIKFSTPKTARGRRSVAIDTETVRVLREHRKRQLEERLALGGYAEDLGLVFCAFDGRPIHPSNLSKWFAKLVARAGVPRIRFHDLRHTHATLALAAGIHPKVVSERLGHSSVSITLDTYSHAIPAMEAEAAERVAAIVAGS